MLNKNRNRILAAAFTVMALVAGALPAAAQSSLYSVRMDNDLGVNIYQIFVSSTSSGVWGPDQLEEEVLFDGSSFTLTGFRAGHYDLRFVDGQGTSCEVHNVSVNRNRRFDITPYWLLMNCQ
jgi:hypothetical protein